MDRGAVGEQDHAGVKRLKPRTPGQLGAASRATKWPLSPFFSAETRLTEYCVRWIEALKQSVLQATLSAFASSRGSAPSSVVSSQFLRCHHVFVDNFSRFGLSVAGSIPNTSLFPFGPASPIMHTAYQSQRVRVMKATLGRLKKAQQQQSRVKFGGAEKSRVQTVCN